MRGCPTRQPLHSNRYVDAGGRMVCRRRRRCFPESLAEEAEWVNAARRSMRHVRSRLKMWGSFPASIG
ncbi:Trm112 family protein [Slackia exigua]|uniref:Trm112 family protein n=1 Tax=Slackia exigua TaxID=84109 RepID=UPI003899CE9F